MIESKYYKEYNYLNDITYLDVASMGLPPQRTLDHCRGFEDVFAKSFGRVSLEGDYERQRIRVQADVARLLHTDPANIMFTVNTTQGTSLLAKSLNLQPGDEIISTAIEYPTILLGWGQRQAEGIRLKLIKTQNGTFSAEDILNAMTERTRVVHLSFVHNHTGFMPDIEKIGAICRERSILFAVDAIQALGRVPVDVEKMNIDYLSTAAFKGLLGVLGSGFVYCCPKLQPMLKPEVYSDYNIVYDEETMTNMMQIPVLPYRQGLEAIQGGSVSSYGITAMGKSIELLLEIGIDRVYSHCLRLENLFRKGLSPLEDKVQILGSKDCKHWSGVICLKFDKDRTKQMKNAFADKKIYAHIREGYLRISFHYYNSPDQVLLTVQALTDVLK